MVTARPTIAGVRRRDSTYYLPLVTVLYGLACLRCGAPAVVADHVVPIGFGGWDWEDNIQPLCKGCNDHRAKKKIEDFRKTPFAVALAGAPRPPAPADVPGEPCFVDPLLQWQMFSNMGLHLRGFCRCHKFDLEFRKQTALTVRLALPVWNIPIRDEEHLLVLALNASASYRPLSKIYLSRIKRGV